VRASIAAVAYFSAYLARREPDVLSALAFAAVVYLLIWPFGVYEAGFQISFIVIAALAVFPARRFKPKTAPQALAADLARLGHIALVASLAALPIVAFAFGQISLLAAPASFLIGLAAPFEILAALAALTLSFVSLPAAHWVMQQAVAPLTGWIEAVSHTIGGPAWTVVAVPDFSGYWLVPIYALALIMWRPKLRAP